MSRPNVTVPYYARFKMGVQKWAGPRGQKVSRPSSMKSSLVLCYSINKLSYLLTRLYRSLTPASRLDWLSETRPVGARRVLQKGLFQCVSC